MGYRSSVVYAIEPSPDSLDKWFVFLAEARNCPTTQLAMQMIDRRGEWADKPKEVWWRGGLDSKNNSILMEEQDDVETRYVNDGYELVRAISYYEIDGSSYQQCDHEQEEITRRYVSTERMQDYNKESEHE